MIRGSLVQVQVGPLKNQPLMICFISGFLFWARFWPGAVFLERKQVCMEAGLLLLIF